ncbi:MAG: FKBP-type peptidyl-prolyl cis-trans isomerase [Fluviicola sp.]|nr:FKBP-type peptidyl-prolyl cis-trans isomerase [Fluviicola sp.]
MQKSFVIGLSLVTLIACTPEEQIKLPDWNNEKSAELNEDLALEEDLDIQMYLVKFEKMKITETGTGLRYIIMKAGDGAIPQPGQDAKVKYKISLLDGTVCYETGKDELDVFRVDKSEMESGIHEGIKLMKIGEKAKLIFPSHLAHGLIGDLKKIPPLSPLVVDIELIEVE